MGSNGTVEFIESLAAPLGAVLGTMVLLGIALTAVRFFTSCQDDKSRAFSEARSSAGKILAVGVVSALLLCKDGAKGLYERLTEGALSSVGTTTAEEGSNALMPSGDGKFGVNSATQSKAAIVKEKGSTYLESLDESKEGTAEVTTWNSGIESAEQQADFKKLCADNNVINYSRFKEKVTPGNIWYSEDFVKELRNMGVTDYSEGSGIKEILDEHNDAYYYEAIGRIN